MRYLVAVFLVLWGSIASAQAPAPASDRDLFLRFTASSERVFRGRCLTAETTDVFVPGARIAATRYVFEVGDGLKGVKTGVRTTFLQVGVRGGGRGDLGRLAGLPTYAPGLEYVLFLLPASRLGTTSPAGAAEGALAVSGDRLLWVSAGHGVSERMLAAVAGRGASGVTDTSGASLDYVRVRAWVAGVQP